MRIIKNPKLHLKDKEQETTKLDNKPDKERSTHKKDTVKQYYLLKRPRQNLSNIAQNKYRKQYLYQEIRK